MINYHTFRNSGIGIQEWGLGFQCLSLAANQKTLSSPSGQWLYILSDKYFTDMILKFITGYRMNIHKTSLVSVSFCSIKQLLQMNGEHN